MRIVIYGSAGGPIPYLRGHQFRAYWEAAGHEVVIVDSLRVTDDGLDASPFDGADVVVLRRLHFTGERYPEGQQDWISDSVIPWLAQQDIGLLWDVDDDLFHVPETNGYKPYIDDQREQVRTLARIADLVTVSTPYVGSIYAPLNPNIRVLRNAIEPDAYRLLGETAPETEQPTLLYYGMGAKMYDLWAGRGYPVAAMVQWRKLYRGVFLGGTDLGGLEGLFDERREYHADIRSWPAAMAGTRPDVGLAPLEPNLFSRARSELHWLEYTACGAATLASGMMGGGPYEVGGDALRLARGREDWSRKLHELLVSAELRADLVGRSRERLQEGYTAEVRAAEWIDALQWVSDHRGIGARSAAA